MTARVLAVAVVMAGCGLPGAPVKDTECSAREVPECITGRSLGVCDTATRRWFEWQCVERCSNAQSPACEIEPQQVGDPCPRDADGLVVCETPRLAVVCRSGRFARYEGECLRCVMVDNRASCT
jgi:hypothetical protein